MPAVQLSFFWWKVFPTVSAWNNRDPIQSDALARKSATSEPSPRYPELNLAHPAELAYRSPDNRQEVATVRPSEALQHIVTLVEASAELKDDTQRKVLLRSVVVVAQKGLGVAPDGVAECEPNVLTFPTR